MWKICFVNNNWLLSLVVLISILCCSCQSRNTELCHAKKLYQSSSFIEAFRIFSSLGAQNDTEAQYYLGSMYLMGYGVERDIGKAIFWYAKAAKRDHAESQYNLFVQLSNENSPYFNKEEAVCWLRKSAEAGVAIAQIDLAACYFIGDGVKKDPSEVVYWLRKASEQGNHLAQGRLGIIYFTGVDNIIEQNLDKAFQLLSQAVDGDDSYIQYYLGIMYYMGYGTKKDEKKGIDWLNKSAKQENRPAQLILGSIYYYRAKLMEKKAEEYWNRVKIPENDIDELKSEIIKNSNSSENQIQFPLKKIKAIIYN